MELHLTATISQLRSVTCHIGSHNVTCYPTQVNTPCLNPDRLVLDLPILEGWKADWLHTAMVYLHADVHPSSTNPAVHGQSNSQPVDYILHPNHYITKPPVIFITQFTSK